VEELPGKAGTGRFRRAGEPDQFPADRIVAFAQHTVNLYLRPPATSNG
jgi:hypothetical protein